MHEPDDGCAPLSLRSQSHLLRDNHRFAAEGRELPAHGRGLKTRRHVGIDGRLDVDFLHSARRLDCQFDDQRQPRLVLKRGVPLECPFVAHLNGLRAPLDHTAGVLRLEIAPANCHLISRRLLLFSQVRDQVENLGIVELQPVGVGRSLGELALEAGDLTLEFVDLPLACHDLVVGLAKLADRVRIVTAIAPKRGTKAQAREQKPRHATIHVVFFPDR